MDLFPVIYAVSFIPLWFYASTAITAIHTVEETYCEIWTELGVPAVAYFAFQSFLLGLGWVAIVMGEYVWLFVGFRVSDVVVTHLLLGAPGRFTAGLLVIDALVICWLM